MKITVSILLLGLMTMNSYGQNLHCDSLTTPNSTIQLLPLQDSVLFSFNNIASDSISFSQNYYVGQWISFNDFSVVDTIIGTIQWSSVGAFLPTYVYPSQTYKLGIVYNTTSIPPNYSLQCYYNIYEPAFGNTCQIPFTLSFSSTTSVGNTKIEHLKIYPNPFRDYINLEPMPEDCEIFIIDLTGKIVSKRKLMKGESQLNLSFLTKGCYFIEIEKINNRQKIGFEKIIKL